MGLPESETKDPNDSSDQKQGDTVPYYKLFKYSTLLDKMLIGLGIAGSIVCGILQPYLMILFGDVSGIIVDYTRSIRLNLTDEEKVKATDALFSGTLHFAIMTSVSAAIITICTYVAVVCLTYSSLRQMSDENVVIANENRDSYIIWFACKLRYIARDILQFATYNGSDVDFTVSQYRKYMRNVINFINLLSITIHLCELYSYGSLSLVDFCAEMVAEDIQSFLIDISDFPSDLILKYGLVPASNDAIDAVSDDDKMETIEEVEEQEEEEDEENK